MPAKSHGLSKSSIYHRWNAMKRRCYNSIDPKYLRYGARGIKVCKKWHKFENFLKDMGPTFKPHLSLDRIDVNGGYNPNNCRWVDQKTQQNNRANNRLVTCNGITKPIQEWAVLVKIRAKLIRQRLDRDKMSPEKALTYPISRTRKPH